MSIVPSLSTLLSLLSFITTVFVLARVGAAAFSANRSQNSESDPRRSSLVAESSAQRAWITYAKVGTITPSTTAAAQFLQFQLGASDSVGRSSKMMALSQAVRFGLQVGGDGDGAERDKEKGKENERGMGEYVGGHDLVRLPASTWTGIRRPGLLFRPPSPFPDQTKPLSMAKLIMSRHQNQRRPSRPPPVRRPPGLPTLPSSRSRLIEEV